FEEESDRGKVLVRFQHHCSQAFARERRKHKSAKHEREDLVAANSRVYAPRLQYAQVGAGGLAGLNVDDDIVQLIAAREVQLGIGDDVVVAELAQALELRRAIYPGDFDAAAFEELNRERPDTAGGTVDENLLPGSQLANRANRLHGQ